MALGKWKSFFRYRRVYSSRTYNHAMKCFEHLTASSLLIFEGKTHEEQNEILGRSTKLSEKIAEATVNEIPLVVSMALIIALQVHDQMIQDSAQVARAK
ncbi:MAG: hypothetical protein ABSG27_11975 [Candidatus Acidiferrales bacterium]|jgi:hypothetical protein